MTGVIYAGTVVHGFIENYIFMSVYCLIELDWTENIFMSAWL